MSHILLTYHVDILDLLTVTNYIRQNLTANFHVHTYLIHTSYIHHTYLIHTSYIHHTYLIHTSYIHHTYIIHTSYIHHASIIYTSDIHHAYDDWLSAINENKIAGSLFLDFSKAFDLVDHSLLIHKLKLYTIDTSWFSCMYI